MTSIKPGTDAFHEYNAQSIQVLKGLEGVRKRPQMYIGGDFHQIIHELLENSIDESAAGKHFGYGQNIEITLHRDGTVQVADDGRGIPVDIHEEEGISAAELIMTKLHAGGKFDNNAYKTSGGLHGVGASVVNALSDWLELKIWRDGYEYRMRFEAGKTINSLTKGIACGAKHGTEIVFMPASSIFPNIDFNFDTIEQRLRELAFLNPGVHLSLEDNRGDKQRVAEFHFEGGIIEFVKYTDRTKQALHETIRIAGSENGIEVEIGMQWNDSYSENVFGYTNNIGQREGGAHVTGYKSGLTRALNDYRKRIQTNKKDKIDISSDDMREGLTARISVKLGDPKFASQTKEKMISAEVRPVVETVVYSEFSKWLEEHPSYAKKILERMSSAAIAREAAKKARELSRKKGALESSGLPWQLAKCQNNNKESTEVFLVEGESAGGSAKQARDRMTQAILPLKGKILNVKRVRFDKVLGSAELSTLINTLGTGIGSDFNIDKLRYGKVIIMTDADIDGAHISTLLMTFFYCHMPAIIEQGRLYIAQPPLYRVRKGQNSSYQRDDKALFNYLVESVSSDVKMITNSISYQGSALDKLIKDVDVLSEFIDGQRPAISSVIEAIALFLDLQNVTAEEDSSNLIAKVLSKLTNIPAEDTSENEIHWSCTQESSGKITFRKSDNGVESEQSVFLSSLKAKILAKPSLLEALQNMQKIFAENNPISLSIKGNIAQYYMPSDIVASVLSFAKKGIYVQRFKGLGEMNPDQLWDTTLNPKTRSLRQLKIGDWNIIEDVFSTLMGEAVEPRRDFIQKNALNVAHLDV